MSSLIKSNKKSSQPSKTSGRFATPEEAAQAKNVEIIAQVKKINFKINKSNIAK